MATILSKLDFHVAYVNEASTQLSKQWLSKARCVQKLNSFGSKAVDFDVLGFNQLWT
jgi:hypothetical protein